MVVAGRGDAVPVELDVGDDVRPVDGILPTMESSLGGCNGSNKVGGGGTLRYQRYRETIISL
jgi:hypothetical protein